MKNHMIKVLFTALLAISFVTQVQASPWAWTVKTPVKTVQLSLPSNNGGVVSVTVPSKATPPKCGIGHGRVPYSAVNQHEDERIAADLERH